MTVLLDAALAYAARDVPFFPCGPNKKPLTKHGFKDATTESQTIRGWWAEHPNASIGNLAVGTITGAGQPPLFQRTSREIQLALKLYW